MILGWSPFNVVSVSAVLYPRWPPLLKIEISSNGQNCSILNQKVPKFELYKHNDELFNIYYGIYFNCVRQRRPVSKMAPLIKLEISSNGQNCSILSQKVPKFELYKHNDELSNIYYGIFYEL
jgi:hypothetical protein